METLYFHVLRYSGCFPVTRGYQQRVYWEPSFVLKNISIRIFIISKQNKWKWKWKIFFSQNAGRNKKRKQHCRRNMWEAGDLWILVHFTFSSLEISPFILQLTFVFSPLYHTRQALANFVHLLPVYISLLICWNPPFYKRQKSPVHWSSSFVAILGLKI